MRRRIRRKSPQRRLDEIDGYLQGLHGYLLRMHSHIREIDEYLRQQHAASLGIGMTETTWRGFNVN